MPLSESDITIINKARELCATLSAEELAGLQPAREPTFYKKRGSGKTYKQKGGTAPREFTAVEVLVDLRKVLRSPRPDPERVIPLYIQLRSLTGG